MVKRMAVKSLKEQLMKIALKNAKLSDGRKLSDAMESEAKRLRDCIQYYIDQYYDDYHPKVYDRTEKYKKALGAQEVSNIRIEGNTLKIGVIFDKSLSMHPNLSEVYWDYGYDKGYTDYRIIRIQDKHDSFVPILMEKGWHSARLEQILGRSVYRLTYFEGIHAVENGIEDFNRTNKLGLKVDAEEFYRSMAY